jgi:competence protein ComEC
MAERQAGWPVSGRGRVALRPGIAAAVVAVVAVTYYAMLTEGGQAVARAAIMGVFVGLALTLRRVPAVAREHGLNVDRYTLLAVGALGILAVKPGALFQPGFQLSFAAVWAIIFVTPKAMWLVEGLPKGLGYAVVGTIAAQLATFPILAWHYGQAPIAGFGANLLAIPLAGVVLVAGMGTCALGVLAPWAAPAAGWLTGVSARWLVQVSSAFAALPGATLEVARPSLFVMIAWYGALVALGWRLGRAAAPRTARAGMRETEVR